MLIIQNMSTTQLPTFFSQIREGLKKEKKILEISNKTLTPPSPHLIGKKIETKNDVRATKRILYDMGNVLDSNRPSYGLSLFYFW